MKKFVLMVLVALGLMLAAPEFASAAPVGPGGLSAAADGIQHTEQAQWRYRYRYRYRYYRVYPRYRYRYWRRW